MKRLALLLSLFLLSTASSLANAGQTLVDSTKKVTESQLRRMVEPLLQHYCQDRCKLLAVNVNVDVAVPDEIAPGFDDAQTAGGQDLVPSAATLKLLIADDVGPVSRGKLIELLTRHLDTLDYPVKIQADVAHFPAPLGTEARVADLRERIAKDFQKTVNDLLGQFCPEQCLLADFELKTDVVNPEETQYGSPGEFVQEGGVAIKIKDISGTILTDDTLPPDERANVLEMAKLKTNSFKRVTLNARSMRFPRQMRDGQFIGGYASGADRRVAGLMPGDEKNSKSLTDTRATSNNTTRSDAQNNSQTSNETNSTSANNSTSRNNSNSRSNNSNNSSETNQKTENYQRIERIERVENGDAVQAELQKFKVFGLIFACSVISLLVFIAMASLRPRKAGQSAMRRVIQTISGDAAGHHAGGHAAEGGTGSTAAPERAGNSALAQRYETENLIEELSAIYAQHPKVAKYVFSRILTEEGVEVTAHYIHIFGESIVVDMLRDASLQADLAGLMEFYAKTQLELTAEEKLDLLRRLHNRTVAGKLVILGNRSGTLFDFLTEMDSTQIAELVRNESLTVKAITLTQCDAQKRANIYANLDEDTRMRLLSELSRIDYLPRDYIFNVANALKRKKKDNPKLNTEALPGSEVLVTLLERTGIAMQRQVVRNLEVSNPDSARTVKSKLVSVDTLRFLRDGQLLEVVLSLKHDELLQFLKGTHPDTRSTIFAKSPKELVIELEEELATLPAVSREAYLAIERKILNRMKLMSNDGLINLIETNDRMFSDMTQDSSYAAAAPAERTNTINLQAPDGEGRSAIKKVSGW